MPAMAPPDRLELDGFDAVVGGVVGGVIDVTAIVVD